MLSYGSSGIFGLSGAKKAKIRVKLPEDPMQVGRFVLQKIAESIATNAKISMEKNSSGLFFKVNGENAGILIGKHGQTLNAIQCIVEKVVNKHNQNRIRVWVDVEGYLDTRRENLENRAMRLAEKAKRLGKPISLGQMNAYDRRIVHLALQDFSDVQTRSRGEGPLRKLVIFPQKRKFSAS